MSDLITSARAKQSMAYNGGTFTADESTLIATLVTAVSKAVRNFCRREFDSQAFDELYHGTNGPRLLLRQYPIISVARVAYGPTAVLTIKNTGTSNQRATVAITSSGLTLVRVASGVVTTDTSITFAGNVTLTALKNAVNALGNGWSATITDTIFNNRASADLRAIQGAFNAKDVNANLKMHVDEVAGYDVDANAGVLYRAPLADDCVWIPGVNNYRVVYTAGYGT